MAARKGTQLSPGSPFLSGGPGFRITGGALGLRTIHCIAPAILITAADRLSQRTPHYRRSFACHHLPKDASTLSAPPCLEDGGHGHQVPHDRFLIRPLKNCDNNIDSRWRTDRHSTAHPPRNGTVWTILQVCRAALQWVDST